PLASPPHPFHNPPMSLANDLTSFAATAVRLGRGVFPRVTAAGRPDPPKLLELYDFEGCPYCRKTREVLCELDLDYLAHPVARGRAAAGRGSSAESCPSSSITWRARPTAGRCARRSPSSTSSTSCATSPRAAPSAPRWSIGAGRSRSPT